MDFADHLDRMADSFGDDVPALTPNMPDEWAVQRVLTTVIERIESTSTATPTGRVRTALRQAARAAPGSEWDELLVRLARACALIEIEGLERDVKTMARRQLRQVRKAAELGRFRAFAAHPPEQLRLAEVVTVSPPDCDACTVRSDDETGPAILRFWASPLAGRDSTLGWVYLCRRCLGGGWFDPEKSVWEMCDPRDTDGIDELTDRATSTGEDHDRAY